MLGVIADDVTGAGDVALALRESGLRTVLYFGVPGADVAPPDGHEAVVVALKSRMAAPAHAVAESLAALEHLREHGVRQVYFKFCSTFDSTPDGNIGPVLDALADALDAPAVLLTPSSPQHGRTQYEGRLFVNGVPLAESPMRHHPVTPMTDSSLPRLLRAQTDQPVEVVRWGTVRAGVEAVRAALTDATARGVRYLLADALDEDDLRTLGLATADAPLTAGAAGLAGGLAHAVPGGAPAPYDEVEPLATWPAAVLAGSCSARTLQQLDALRAQGRPLHRLDPVAEPDPATLAGHALDWYDALPPGSPHGAPVLHSSVEPDELRAVQRALGAERAAAVLEEATGRIAAGLASRGVRRIIAAGGETSGSVVTALGITGAWIGRAGAPGVPWIHPTSGPDITLLLKSGNFGAPDFLVRASAAPRDHPLPQGHSPSRPPDLSAPTHHSSPPHHAPAPAAPAPPGRSAPPPHTPSPPSRPQGARP
ncbi:3-oxo-tetronate kinase [Streptomyces flavofungini]|uniref:3-oxo-tetronate kinase n=1 Tax=Streptomyces flavofungini TaxID=68200 RepID=A0ABS0XA19_9ACTN|nr:3-oxo-tetronate kinase [Streptomyces flavofungini]MBJ3809866.1 four-carbon acid sugar kinase family protein [Streptomyces flavofungini]GHC54461.1 HPr kinase [Streptomyces flavofungini]